jgi:flagellum-specific peptidoglycan hydrolase FlgJ
MQEWTYLKSEFVGVESPRGIMASIIMAEIIFNSRWGEHPIAQPEVGNKYSNNLVLLEVDSNLPGRFNLHQGKEYRAYKDWEAFCVDYTDYLVFSGLFNIPLLCRREQDQIKALSYTKPNYKLWGQVISNIIKQLNLSDFNS